VVELVTRTDGLDALADEWRRLAVRRGNPFITPEWFQAWLRAYGPGWAPHVAVVRSPDGGLQGLVPLIRSTGARRATLRSCRGDRFHPVAEPGDEEAVAAAAATALAPRDRPVGSLVLDNVDSDAGWWPALAAAAPAGLATVKRPEIPLPFVELQGLSWEQYLAGRSRDLRSQLGRKMRSLHREHEVRVRRTQRREELPDDLSSLFALHEARWAQRGDVSAFAKPAVRAFHADFAAAALERGWLRLYLLEVDGAPIAASYGWLIGTRWSYLQAGLDPAWSRHSPGFLLLAETIREAISQGASEYDMLLGNEAYKLRFATSSRRGHTVVLARRSDSLVRLSAASRARLRGAWQRLPAGSRAHAKKLAVRIGVLG
jgi:CelD/BcsL family acetyltransferase involved in cellulose biosynthesis